MNMNIMDLDRMHKGVEIVKKEVEREDSFTERDLHMRVVMGSEWKDPKFPTSTNSLLCFT